MATNPTTEFSANVPVAEYEFFKENFPQYGAVTWFITSALFQFNEVVRQNPSVKEQINEAISNMLALNRAISSIEAGAEVKGLND